MAGSVSRWFASIVAVWCMLQAGALVASHHDPEPVAVEPETENEFFGTIDDTQQVVSDVVVGLSRNLDHFFGTEQHYDDEAYESLLRLRFSYNLSDDEERLRAQVGGRLRLAGAEERFSLVFDSEDPDDPAERDRADRSREPDDGLRQRVGLEFLQPFESVDTDATVRIRSGRPVDFFTRVRAWRNFEPASWRIRPRWTTFNSERTGTGHTAEIRFDHPVGNMRARSDTATTWFRREEQYYYDQTFSLLQPLARRRDLRWQIGAEGESEPRDELTLYYAQIRWRSVIHRDWLVAEVRPQWRRDIEDDFSTEFRLYLGFDVLFGHPVAY